MSSDHSSTLSSRLYRSHRHPAPPTAPQPAASLSVSPSRRSRSSHPPVDTSLVSPPPVFHSFYSSSVSLSDSLKLLSQDPTSCTSTGQLPASAAALKRIRRLREKPLEEEKHELSDSFSVLSAAPPTKRSKFPSTSAGSVPYLRSPFSFIDKVLDSPYTDEFVYLSARSGGPYDLEIVRHDSINPHNYYTMSRAGVTHFHGSETSFTSLDQWEREYFLFSKIQQIPFFRDFRGWKSFFFWRKLIKFLKIAKCKRILQDQLYILNPYLRPSLLDLRSACYAASKWSLFRISPRHTLTLTELVQGQEQQKEHLHSQLQQLQKEIRRIVSKACREDLNAFLVENGFRSSAALDSGSSTANPLHKVSHAERAANRTKCRKLTKYIRLVDYFLIDTLISLALERTSDLLAHIERRPVAAPSAQPKKPKAALSQTSAMYGLAGNAGAARKDAKAEEELPLFSVDLELEPSSAGPSRSLCFVPELRDFQSSLDQSVDSCIRRLMAPQRLLHDADFSQYTKANAEESSEDGGSGDSAAQALENLVLDDPLFRQLKNGVSSGLASAFHSAAQYALQFEAARDIFVANEALDISSFAGAPINVFSELIAKFHSQSVKLQAMATEAKIGIIRVDSSRLKALFTPSPLQRIGEIERLIPLVAREKCRELFEKLRDANTKISRIPATVEEFVDLMAFLSKIHEESENDQQAYLFVQELYHLCQEHGIRIPEQDKANFEKLTQTRQTFKTSILLSEAGINGNTERFSKELEGEIPALNDQVKSVLEELKHESIANVDSPPEEVIAYLEDRDATLSALEEKAQRFQYYQDVLQVDVAEFAEVRNARADLDVKLSVWNSLKTWGEFTAAALATKLEKIDVDEMNNQVSLYNKVYSKARRMLENNPVVNLLKERIGSLQNTLPVVADLRCPHLKVHHWDAIQHLLQHDIQHDPDFTLGTLIQLNAMAHRQEIAIISNKAQQEAQLRQLLDKVIDTWTKLNFPVIQHRDQKDVYILGNLDDILSALDDTLVTIATIQASRYVDPIKEEVSDWNNKLALFQETCEEWTQVQRQWLYLETIFSSQDIVRQLPDEFSLFSKVDRAWREIMRRTNDQPNCIIAGTYVGLRDNFRNYNTILDKVQKQLESYLETRRQQFPRFYFLSSDELIKILSQSKSVAAVQPHLRKCFDNIQRLEFSSDSAHSRDIRAMFSAEGERVPLGANLKARGSAEAWLPALESDMVKTLRRYVKRGVSDYERMNSRADWVVNSFGQIVATVSQIAWCRGCESAIMETASESDPKKAKLAMQRWYDIQVLQLQELTALVRGDLSDLDRGKIVALITTDVHCRDIVGALRDAKVSSLNNFLWRQQLRFYWDTEEDDCLVRQSNATFNYGYEYEGVTTRLVITPLTDRCWMTITGALNLKFGAAPAGPAGTGKTESTKDLAKALGVYCVVFNCSEQVTYKTMAKLFSGLAQTGAWTCLDEFNRIDIEVLSVIAQQLLQVRQALLVNASDFNFQGQQIRLKSTFGCMITMNPGYAGRTELPDNLKVLFRPVSMMIPDYASIAEIMLFAEGFDSAQSLSKKMVKLYKLASEQLSQQSHYDYGLRAVKSLLVTAGSLKRSQPHLSEDVVLIRAMRDANLPKFLSDDIPLFNAIIQDLFPAAELPEVSYGDLQSTVESTLTSSGLQCVPAFVTKVLQLYDTFNVRFGVMLVGPTGSGKSACQDALRKSLNALNQRGMTAANGKRYQAVHAHTLNPKAISMNELYGFSDPLSQEWTDGLGSSIMRSATSETTPDHHWIVFDGPVDALWIENMNTVLDDNQTLCLVNGERIKLRSELRMLFEVEDLAVASPATVSRCGMVYLSPEQLGYLPYVQSWLKNCARLEQLSDEAELYIAQQFEAKLPLTIQFSRENGKEPLASVDLQLAASVCSIFESLFNADSGVDFNESFDELRPLIDMILAFSVAWAIGGALDFSGQRALNKYLFEQFLNVRPPNSFFESFVDIKEKAWKSWESIVPAFEYDAKIPYFQLLVPTVDTVRYQSVMQTLLAVEKPVFLTGHTGVGKSVLVADFVNHSANQQRYYSVSLTFSAATDSKKTQENIESKLVKYRKTLLGAPQGKKAILVIDDVNMPSKQTFGAIPAIELLRQMVEYRGVYDRQKLFWKSISDTTLVCAAAPPGGGRNQLTQRFTRHFAILCLPQPHEGSLKKIFSSILGGFLSTFKGSIQKLKDSVVNSTVELFESICVELLPTPAKSHYTFNLRDISKVFQGLCMLRPQSCAQPETLVRGWIHESSRCFADRLINQDDRHWFNKRICTLLQKNFGLNWNQEELFEREPIQFGDFYRPGAERVYEENTKGIAAIAQLLDDYQEELNLSQQTNRAARSNAGPSTLVFFNDAIAHISRICRILRQPRGNAMLVGVGGSGKQSLTRLACAMNEMQCVEMEITRGFGYAEFQDHLKKIFHLTGVQGKDAVLLITDNQIVEERFLEDINNVLNNGEVPNLYTHEETNKLIDDLSSVLRDLPQGEAPVIAGRTGIYNAFIQRVRDHLHIVLCMSPVGESFRVRCRQFPSLINCTTIDWFNAWPRSALFTVAARFLKEVELPNDEVRQSLIDLCVEVHTSVEESCGRFERQLRRKVYTTPKSYLDFLRLFVKLLGEKRAELATKRNFLLSGLTKLAETKVVVADLQETLQKLRPILIDKTRETESLLSQVATDQAEADKVRAVVEVEEKEVNARTQEVRDVQADAQADLDLAMPALRAALKSLEKLKKAEISEVKSMANPPVGVVRCMEAVCILLGHAPDWQNAQKVLANVNFLKTLREFDKDHIDPKVIKKLQKYVTDPELTEDRMMSVSRAATAILMWVNAMVEYSKVAKVVAPKRARVEQMNALLEEANKKLKEKQDQLAAVVANVAALKAKCDATIAEKSALDAKLTQTEKRLERASKLTSGLAGEEVRWAADAESLAKQLIDVVGNVFVSASAIGYYGPFTGEYRSELIKRWHQQALAKQIPTSLDYSLASTLGSPLEIRQWNINGLPTDSVSIDSGILTRRGVRWPLCIDPQEQAKKWIKNEYKAKLIVTKFNSRDLLKQCELALSTGVPLLIEDCSESIDPMIDPILLRQTFMKGGLMHIRLGDKDVEYHDKFRLYLTTKLPNPHYLPELQIKVTLLNFTVTLSGLTDQLLGEVVKKERPDIEDKKNRLVILQAKDRKQLNEIEDRILQLLKESSGNILDDENLIETLEESKFTSAVIHKQVKESTQTQHEISIIRERYRPAALRGAILYFAVSDLALIDPMYQYSLAYFLRLFNLCIDQSEASPELEQRLQNLLRYMTAQSFFNICRGLFERHKLLFSFLLCSSILRNAGEISEFEWNALLRDSLSKKQESENESANPMPELISDQRWAFLLSLDRNIAQFKNLTLDFASESSAWRGFIGHSSPQSAALPSQWGTRLSAFQRLLLIKALRPEKLLFACSDFVRLKMGPQFVDSNPAGNSLEEIYKDSEPTTPIIFILSQGADPTSLLLRFAKERNFQSRLQILSLGQGQGEAATKLIENAKIKGEWVLLQNAHLAKSWMNTLEELVNSFGGAASGEEFAQSAGGSFTSKVHPDFRLWLTSMPADYFPVSVLQKGIKITNEPPAGLKANILRTFASIVNPNDFESSAKPHEYKKLLFGLSFFHGIIQERKKFGPLGWCKVYEFNDSDLETSLLTLRMFLDEAGPVPFDALKYVIGEINYGGRVTDANDRRCLMAILDRFITPSILEDRYQFSQSGIYFAPPQGPLASYLSYLEQIPSSDDPEVFGMHENANLSFQRVSSATLIETILSVQPREVSSASGLSSDAIVAALAHEIEEKMPSLLDRKRAGPESIKSNEAGLLESLSIVLLQEMDRFNNLLNVMRSSLVELQRAIRGEALMSSDLDLMFSSLLNNQVPAIWQRAAFPSLKPLASWIVDLHNRIQFLADWLVQGPPNSFWMSGFFFPQGFMTGVLQTHARKYQLPIDSLTFQFEVMKQFERREVERPPSDGVYIDGLFLDGARWDSERCVIEDSLLGELFAPMPIIHFLPVQANDTPMSPSNQKPDESNLTGLVYEAPIYKTSVRAGVLSTTGQSTNYILSVQLPSSRPPEYWILKGAACLCQLDN